jgi:hypothetical protein
VKASLPRSLHSMHGIALGGSEHTLERPAKVAAALGGRVELCQPRSKGDQTTLRVRLPFEG